MIDADAPHYTRTDLEQRLARRRERLGAAIAAHMRLHRQALMPFLVDPEERPPNGRFAAALGDWQELALYGERLGETVLRVLTSDLDDEPA